jgi:DNA-binding response OmpR family regulator
VTAQAQTVLVVEDESSIASFVALYLKNAGYAVRTVATGGDALAEAESQRPDLIVLDLMLPDVDGIEVCRRIRQRSDVPILMLTARDEDVDKIIGLEVGADDYLTKPFSLRELAVRVKAILRRVERIRGVADQPATGPIDRHGMMLDAARRRVEVDGDEVALTPLEFEILLTLARDPGVVMSRDSLMDGVWGYRDYAGGRVVDSHVARIRRKLGEDGNDPRFIRTVHGVGYAFKE